MRDVFRHGDDLTARVEDTFDFLAVVDEQEYRVKGMQFLCDCKVLHIGFLTRHETAIISLDWVWNDGRTRRGRTMLIGNGRGKVSFGDPVIIGLEVRLGGVFLGRVAASSDSFAESSANFGS
jgi:hypothetical protein